MGSSSWELAAWFEYTYSIRLMSCVHRRVIFTFHYYYCCCCFLLYPSIHLFHCPLSLSVSVCFPRCMAISIVHRWRRFGRVYKYVYFKLSCMKFHLLYVFNVIYIVVVVSLFAIPARPSSKTKGVAPKFFFKPHDDKQWALIIFFLHWPNSRYTDIYHRVKNLRCL